MKRNKMKIAGLITVCTLFWVMTACTTSEGKGYGLAIDTKKGEAVTLADVFAKPAALEGKNVIIQGKTGMICRTAGCWLMLQDGTNQILVQFYTFTVRPAVGTTIRAQGVLKLQNQVPYLVADGLEIVK